MIDLTLILGQIVRYFVNRAPGRSLHCVCRENSLLSQYTTYEGLLLHTPTAYKGLTVIGDEVYTVQRAVHSIFDILGYTCGDDE